MQLLSFGFLNIVLTALLVCTVLASLATFLVWMLRPARTSLPVTFLSVFAFAILGFVVGKVMGNSRETAVGTVVPAVLTLLGGISLYVIGVKGTRAQAPVSAMMLSFAMSLFAGSHFGAQLRYDYELFLNDPELIARRALVVEQKRQAIELQRLLNYVELVKLKKGFEEEGKIDLSKFQSTLERPADDSKPENESAKDER